MLNKTRLRAAIFVALALIALQSFMPLAGELLVKNGWISSASMQVVCSQSGVKFISTAELNQPNAEHSVKCPWCQLGEPAVLPSSLVITITEQRHALVTLPRPAPALPSAPWLLAPARAPPVVVAHFAHLAHLA